MDIRELKELLKNSTSVLILDNGEPSYVILDYEVYRRLIGAAGNNTDNSNGVHGENNRNLGENHQSEPDLVDLSGKRSQLSPQETEALERLNREIQALKEQIEQEERQSQQ
jgi:hypothetical protein